MMLEQVVSLSGGKDSTAMLFLMLEHGERIDDIIYFDTGWEYPEMEEHIEKIERLSGLNITKLHPEKSFDYWMFDHARTRGAHIGEKGYGWARPNARWCTSIKTHTIDAYLKGRDVIQCVGIAADEQRRIRDKRYPLVEWNITERAALEYCYSLGFDWGGLYDHMDRVSCFCCPLQGLRQLRALRSSHPELWERLQDMDRRSPNDFRFGCPVSELERRFASEDNQLEFDFAEE